MFKRILAIHTMFSMLFAAIPVFAKPDFSSATLSTPGTSRTLTLPQAADSAPVISLGTSVDPGSGELVEGYAIVHYRQAGTHRTGHAKPAGGSTCYGYLASGAKWKSVEPWIMNPFNSRGLDPASTYLNFDGDIAKWEDVADGVVGNSAGVNILGSGIMVTSGPLVADTVSPDDLNEVYFGEISDPGAIAVTIVWGIFGGPPSGRKLVEWDMVFDEVDYDWSLAGEGAKMDFENIATHELGHAVGLGDLYTTSCSEETMYGYADYGETKKRDLGAGDIAGINKLY